MSDFEQQFAGVVQSVTSATKGVLNAIDQMLFKSLVACLKSEDYEAATTAINQLVKEKKPIAIPPLYFVSQAHPNARVRENAKVGLKAFKQDKTIAELTEGKELKVAVSLLIKEFGNYKN